MKKRNFQNKFMENQQGFQTKLIELQQQHLSQLMEQYQNFTQLLFKNKDQIREEVIKGVPQFNFSKDQPQQQQQFQQYSQQFLVCARPCHYIATFVQMSYYVMDPVHVFLLYIVVY